MNSHSCSCSSNSVELPAQISIQFLTSVKYLFYDSVLAKWGGDIDSDIDGPKLILRRIDVKMEGTSATEQTL